MIVQEKVKVDDVVEYANDKIERLVKDVTSKVSNIKEYAKNTKQDQAKKNQSFEKQKFDKLDVYEEQIKHMDKDSKETKRMLMDS